MPWNSIRNNWPQQPGEYKVLDCRMDTQARTRYDGFEFTSPNIYFGEMEHSYPKKFTITHWKEVKEVNIDKIKQTVEKHKREIGEL